MPPYAGLWCDPLAPMGYPSALSCCLEAPPRAALRRLLLILAILAFGAADALIKGQHGGPRNAVANKRADGNVDLVSGKPLVSARGGW